MMRDLTGRRHAWSTATFVVCVLCASIGAELGAQTVSIVDAARRADVGSVRALLQQGAGVNAADADGSTALHWAAHHDDEELVDELVRAGANVDASNDYGIQPLVIACTNGSEAVVKRLLKAGASANTSQGEGETVLMTAARAGSGAVVRMLLEAGADANALDSWRGQTALMWASAEGHTDVVGALLSAGAQLHARAAPVAKTARARAATPSNVGFTPLAFAVRGGHIETVKVLLDAGANLQERTASGLPLLHLAILNAHFELAQVLLDRGADPNQPTPAGLTPLHHVVQIRRPVYATRPAPVPTGSVDSLSLMQTLIDRGARLEAGLPPPKVRRPAGEDAVPPPGGGATPLWLAARGPDVAAMRLLLKAGANSRVQTDDGVTLLMTAAGIGFRQGTRPKLESEVLDAVKLALEHGGDLHAADIDGATALHGAALRGVNSVVLFLVDKGAQLHAQDKRQRRPIDVAEDASDARSQPETAALLRKLMTRTPARH